MRRGVRIALIVLAVPVVLLLVLWTALYTVGNTTWGRVQIETLVAHLTSNTVRVHGIGGELPNHLTLQEVQLADTSGIWLQAQNLEARWHPWALLEKRVWVDTAHAQRIDFTRLPLSRSKSSGHAHIPDIDVREIAVDTVNLSAALAATPSSVNLHGSAHLRTLQDMQFVAAATRLDGEGTYSAQLSFDSKRMDAVFHLREPAHGPLAGLLGIAGVGPIEVAGSLAGQRQAEHIDLQGKLGDLTAAVAGSVDLVHKSADLTFAADATAMAPRADLAWQQLHLKGNWHGPLAQANADAQLQLRALATPGGVRIGALGATLAMRGGSLATRAQLTDSVVPGVPAGLLTSAALNVEGSIEFELPTRPFELRASHPAFVLRAKGQAGTGRSLDAEFETADMAKVLPQLSSGLSGPLRVHATAEQSGARTQARVTASGNLDATQAVLHQWLRGPETADLRAAYEAGEVRLEESTVGNKALNLTASGRLNAPQQHGDPWTLAGKSRLVLADLSIALPAVSGQATLRADLSGNTAALRLAGDVQSMVSVHGAAPGAIQGTFDLADVPAAPRAKVQLRGQLAGQPLTLQADVQRHPGQGENLHIGLAHADWESLHAQGDLMLAQDLSRSTGQFKVTVADLADLNQILSQHLGGSLTGSLNLAPGGSTVNVTTQGLQIGTLKLDATLTGTGPLQALQLSLAAQSPLLGEPAHLTAQAALDASKSSVSVNALAAVVRGVDVKLLQPATVEFAHGLNLAGLRLGLADAQLQAAGQILPQLQFNAELTDETVSLVNALLPDYLDSGSLKATASLQGTLAHPEGQLRLTGTDLRAGGDGSSLPAAQLAANVDLTADGAKISVHSSAGESSHMAVEGSVPWSGPLAVTASGVVDLARLNPLMESAGRRITGTVSVDAQISGTRDAPSVKGEVQLLKGSIHDYRHGIDLTQIEGKLEGTQDELRVTDLTAHAATGTVSVTGTIGVLKGGWPVDMRFTAKNAQPFNSSIVTGVMNADLTLQGTALHELTLAGTIAINRAVVEIPNSFPPNVAVLDVRRPGQQPVVPASNGPVFNLKVSVNAPRQILVRGRGLDAELGGRIEIGGTARAPSVDGGFDLQRGLFTIAGSRLSFSSGRVSFAGSDVTGKIDPTLDFTASTTALDTTVTLRITGVADAPQFELTSVPQLPQDEILARLLFGESAGQLTAIQAAQLGAALVTLTGGGGGFNPLAEIQKHLGLDRLAVGSNDTGTPGSTQNTGATIEAGRYVTNRIFVDLKQNTTGATQLQVDVDLTNKLKLQTRIGTGTATVQGTTPDNDPGSSVGLSYRFEY